MKKLVCFFSLLSLMGWVLVVPAARATDSDIRARPDTLSHGFDGISPELYTPILFPHLRPFWLSTPLDDEDFDSSPDLRDLAARARAKRIRVSPRMRDLFNQSARRHDANLPDIDGDE